MRLLGRPTATDAARDEIRAVLAQLKADCESLLRNIHSRTLVMDIGGGSLPTSIADTTRLDEICWDLAGRVDDGWGQIRDRVSRVSTVVFGLQGCHAVAVLRDKKASLGFEHGDQDYGDLTAKISEVIVRVEACLCALDHHNRSEPG